MLEIVYAENSEPFLWENSERFYLMQKIDFINICNKHDVHSANFINVEIDFINAEK